MRYRLVRRLAQVAHEGVILDADALEAVLGMCAAVGAGRRESSFIICSGVADGIVFVFVFLLYFVVVVVMEYGMT